MKKFLTSVSAALAALVCAASANAAPAATDVGATWSCVEMMDNPDARWSFPVVVEGNDAAIDQIFHMCRNKGVWVFSEALFDRALAESDAAIANRSLSSLFARTKEATWTFAESRVVSAVFAIENTPALFARVMDPKVQERSRFARELMAHFMARPKV